VPVELALTPVGSWGVGHAVVVDAAREAGFTAAGAFLPDATVENAAHHRATGVRCHELIALRFGADPDDALAQAQSLAAGAETLGARWVLGVFLEPVTPAICAVLPRVASTLGEVGAGLAIEFVPMGPVATIADGLEVVELAGPDHAGLLVDTWHFFVGPSTWGDLEALRVDRLAYVQFDDALPPDPDHLMRATMRHRLFPGDGSFELERFASTLLDRGWEGDVSVEVLSDELAALPVPEFARRAYEATARYWT
jgi:sugar phosphate isomerase/epimerase